MSELAINPIKSRVEKSPSLKRLYNNIMKDLEEVEQELRLFSHSPNRLISDISTYLFQTNGKRIRPALLLLCSKLFGYKGKEHILMSTLVEAIHTASLIHDDIIDNSIIRRGKESIHTRWGPNITVLLGDYLYIKALGLSLQSKHRQITQILTSISARMVEGELTEYYLSGNLELAEKDYLDIINKKTASLFSASCRIGGILGKASKKEENYLAEYGTNLGMSFQIIDDLLDFTGNEKILGKPILCDLSEGRITLPLIYTLNNDGRDNKKRVMELLKQKNQDRESLEEVLKIVKSNGALDYTHKKAEEFSHKSREIISQFPKSTQQEALSLLSEFILKRRN
ncbi:MAG TPA: polyprenyl synthetase family protein [Candidatus Aminicenantes bacterium]|nr:polyprenyl synthetase family protein [Candidatus Aminicenantes bacterium]